MRVRLALATLPIIALLWMGIGGYLVQKRQADLEEAGQASRNLAHAFEENIRRSIEAIDTTIRALRVARAHDPAHFDLRLWERESGLTRDLTLQLSLADASGALVASNLGELPGGASIADRDHFRVARDQPDDRLFISRPVIGRISGRWSVQFVRKLFDQRGTFDGVVVASLDPAFLARFYGSLDIGRGALLLSGADGIVRAVAPDGVTDMASDLSDTALIAGVSAAAHGTVRMDSLPDGIDRIYSWRRIDPYGLVATVGLSSDDVLADYQRDLHGCVAIGIALTLITLSVSSVLARNRRDAARAQAILRAAVDNISQGLLVVDAQRRIPLLNARAAELLDLPGSLAKPGVAFDALLQWQVQAGEFEGPDAEHVRTLVQSGGIEHGSSVYQRTRRNGTVLEIRTKSLASGLAVRTITDITEQERTARVLADARDAAEAAARSRSEFLAVMSHEIRTPLNGVIGVAELLDGMELASAQRSYVRLIRESGNHLLALINDILDFSRLEASRLQLEEVDFDPVTVIESVIDLFLAQADSKGLALSARTGATVAARVTGDPGRLRQILLNLVGNAIKFTGRGSVTLSLEQAPAIDGRVELRFSVADSGIGIVPEAVDRMFQDFTQMDASISRRFGGSGLGLAICRRLVELMGGTITVESQPGLGSVFRFDVMVRPASDLPAAGATVVSEPETARNLRVLVAEDNLTNQFVALRLLERLGHHAEAVGDGAAAVSRLGLEPDHYDLVLMDVMMPEMDGLTATRRIRASEGLGSHVTIVGLTAGARAENLSDCLTAGMDAVTTKPVTLASLRAAIAEGLEAAGRRPGCLEADPCPADLREALGDDLLQDILVMFGEDTQINLDVMRDAASRNDLQTLGRIAHSVAGAARTVGAAGLDVVATRLQHDVGSLSASTICAAIDAMQAEFDAALAGLGIAPVNQPGTEAVCGLTGPDQRSPNLAAAGRP